MVDLSLTIPWEYSKTHTQTGHTGHTQTPTTFMLFLCWWCKAAAKHPWCFAQLLFWMSYPKVDLLANSIRQAVSPAHLNNNNKAGQSSMHD